MYCRNIFFHSCLLAACSLLVARFLCYVFFALHLPMWIHFCITFACLRLLCIDFFQIRSVRKTCGKRAENACNFLTFKTKPCENRAHFVRILCESKSLVLFFLITYKQARSCLFTTSLCVLFRTCLNNKLNT